MKHRYLMDGKQNTPPTHKQMAQGDGETDKQVAGRQDILM